MTPDEIAYARELVNLAKALRDSQRAVGRDVTNSIKRAIARVSGMLVRREWQRSGRHLGTLRRFVAEPHKFIEESAITVPSFAVSQASYSVKIK